MLQQGTVNYLC